MRTRMMSWRKWLKFCTWLSLAFKLTGFADPITYLQMFAYRLQVVSLENNGAGVKKSTMEIYLRDVAQIFTILGGNNPCLYNLGRFYIWFIQKLCAYKRANPKPQLSADNPHRPNSQVMIVCG